VPLLSNRVLLFLALVLGAIALVVYVVKPALEGGTDEPGFGPSRTGAGPTAPPDQSTSEEPAPAPPKQPRPQPTNAAEVIVTFPQALAAVRGRLGPHAQLTSVNVNEISVLFSYRLGRTDRAAVLRWRPETETLETADRAFAGTQPASEQAFPIGAVSAVVPAILIARLRRIAPADHVVHTVHLFRLPVSNGLIWQLTVESGGRYLTYRARPDGGGLRELR
jgi:hypothetical protein